MCECDIYKHVSVTYTCMCTLYVIHSFIAAPCTPDKEVEQLEGLGGKRGQVSRSGGAGAGEGSVKRSRRSEREVHHEVLPCNR